MILSLLPFAFVTIIGIPIIFVLMLLGSQKPGKNHLVFLASWYISLFILVTLVGWLVGPGYQGGNQSSTAKIVQIILGVLFAYFAIANVVKRNEDKDSFILKMIRGINYKWLIIAGLGMNLINPVNIAATIGASGVIKEGGYNLWGGAAVFSLLSSFLISIPVIIWVCFPKYSKKIIDSSLNFFQKYDWLVNAIILALFAYSMFSKAFG